MANQRSIVRTKDSRKKLALSLIHLSSWGRRIKNARQALREYRLWLVGLMAAVGVILILAAGSAALFGHGSFPLGQSVLVNFGTAIIFGAVFVFLQPRLTRAVGKAVDTAVRPMARQVEEIRERVATLTERTAELFHAEDERVDQIVSELGESPSFQTITAALQAANDMNAFVDGIATVQGGKDPVEDQDVTFENPLSVRVRFLWGSRAGAPGGSLLIHVVCDEEQYINVHRELIETEDDLPGNNNDRLCCEVTWEPGNLPEEVGARIRQGLISEGLYRGDAAFEWGKTIAELQRTISVAVASRRAGVWPIAPLFELVGDDWAITRAGVEYRYSREYGPVFMPEDFPSWYPGGSDYDDPESAWRPPRSPSGVPQPGDRLLDRAAAYLPLRTLPDTPSGWNPMRTA